MTISILFIQGGGQGAHAEDEPLAKSLEHALGSEYDVQYPRMPDESDPDFDEWKKQISSALAGIRGDVILVGHSLGGAALLKYLAEETIDKSIAGIFLLAAPAWDNDKWNFDDLKLPRDVSERVASIRHIFFYQCRDDDIVPFKHLSLHGTKFPQAIIRPIKSGGHQFGNDLIFVAKDIQHSVAAPPNNSFKPKPLRGSA